LAKARRLEERVTKLVKDWGCNGKEAYIAELINTALKLAKDGSDELDLKIVNRAVKECATPTASSSPTGNGARSPSSAPPAPNPGIPV